MNQDTSLKLPVNPTVLKWARETGGYSVSEVASRLKRKSITSLTIIEWEQGESAPTYAQLESLAYKIYHRPIALFFFPTPPIEELPEQSFRTLPSFEIENLQPHFKYLVRSAIAMRINLRELLEDTGPTISSILNDLNFNVDDPIDNLISSTRSYFGIDVNQQVEWRDTKEAFINWRAIFESYGIFVFKDAFKNDEISGFCLYDDQYPIIYINNSKPYSRQIFTLFHELAHLLYKTGGIDVSYRSDFRNFNNYQKKIESICNEFAGSFLVPNDNFHEIIRNKHINQNLIYKLADHYCVSREVILRKLLDLELIDQDFYDKSANSYKLQLKPTGTKNGGNYYSTRCVYLGYNYINLVFKNYYQNRITQKQVAQYLGVKLKNIAGFEQRILNQGGIK